MGDYRLPCHCPTRSMTARKCVHAQKPYPSQAFTHESSKVGDDKKGKKGDKKDRETDRHNFGILIRIPKSFILQNVHGL